MTDEQRKILEGMRLTNHGQALQAVLKEKRDELNNVTTCKSWEETLGRKYAVELIDDIFSFMREKVVTSNKTRYD